jgi:predicted branched-subunit amino acid permease
VQDEARGVQFSMAGLRTGAVLVLPALPSVVVLGLVFGALSAQSGLSLLESAAMSVFVFAGASQLSALELWQTPLPIFTIIAVTAAVNSRLLLMGAALRPWFRGLPPAQLYGSLAMIVDMTWATALRYRAEGGNDAAVLLGGSLGMIVLWVGATGAGHALGSVIRDPAAYGFDLIVPIFFTAILVTLWRGRREAAPWAVAAATALVVSALLPSYWYVLIGALAGSLFASLRHDA